MEIKKEPQEICKKLKKNTKQQKKNEEFLWGPHQYSENMWQKIQ